MNFDVGDRVKLTVDKQYADGTVIPAGTKGAVEKTYPLSTSYLVAFDGVAPPSRRVPETDLAPA